MKKMRCKGFEIWERKDGTFKVRLKDCFGDNYEDVCENFREAGMWVWNMADNHDIAHVVNEKMCDVFGKTYA